MEPKTRNILVIDDDQAVLEAIMDILEYSGYQPKGMTSIDDHIFQILKSGHFGLVILDVMLSEADGRDLTVRLKNSEETSSVPILMISAYPEIEPSVVKAGADDFLEKPFGLDELTQKVEQVMSLNRT